MSAREAMAQPLLEKTKLIGTLTGAEARPKSASAELRRSRAASMSCMSPVPTAEVCAARASSSASVASSRAAIDLSKATSLLEIRALAFYGTGLQGTLVIPSRVTKIGSEAFWNTELTGLDLSKATHLSKATSLVEIGGRAFADASVEGTLV